MGTSSVADSRPSSRQGSADQPLRIVLPDAQPVGGLSAEAQAAQWQVVPPGDGAGMLIPAVSPTAAPVPPIGVAGADSAASPPREKSRHRMSRTQPDDSETQRTWLSRVQDKTQVLREAFQLEATENVMDDFVCALKKRILLQGRMYVFEHYVCFHSNVLGYVKNKIIPLKEVTAVRKRKNVGFPNSIEITWGPDGKREFFTSFLSREDAYRLIMATWAQCSGYANLFTDSRGDDAGDASGSGARIRARVQQSGSSTAENIMASLRSSSDSTDARDRDSFLHKSAAKLFKPVPRRRTDQPLPSGPMAPQSTGGSSTGRASVAGQAVEGSVPSRTGHRLRSRIAARLRRDHGDSASPTEGDADVDPDGGDMTDPDADPDVDVDPDADDRSEQTVSVDQTDEDDNPSYRNDSDDNSTEPADDQVWTAQPLPAPPLNPAMQQMVQGEIVGVDVRSFCQTYMADGVPFFIDFHRAKGDEQVQLSPWRNHHNMGRVRELQFVTQLKSRIGPPKAMCYQTQKYTMYQGDVFVYETSQVMPDIPYGDCFTVESRWNVTNSQPMPDGTPRVAIETYVMVNFARSTIWKKAIESGVIASCRNAHEEWLKAAKAVAESGNVVSFAGSRQSSLRGNNSPDVLNGNGRPPPVTGPEPAKQRIKALRESAGSSQGPTDSPAASQQGDAPVVLSTGPVSDAQLKAFVNQVGPDQKRDLLRLLRVSPPGPQSPGRTTPASPAGFTGRTSADGGGPGFRLPAVAEGGSDGRSTPTLQPLSTAAAAALSLKQQQRQRRGWLLQPPVLLLALGACIAVLQLLILSGRWGPRTGAGPPAPTSSVSSSWTPRGGPADSAASAVQGMLPGEPLWSGDASTGGPSGWAPYWAGRFELLQGDMQTLQRRMEFLRNEVMAAVVSGRWEPPTASDAGSSVGEL